MEFNPEATKVGYIYNPGEANSVASYDKLKDYCLKNNLEIVEAAVTSSSELQTAASVVASKVDFIFVSI